MLLTRNRDKNHQLKLQEVMLNPSKTTTLLGVELNDNLTWAAQIKKIENKMFARINGLMMLKAKGVNSKCLLMLYRATIRPIMEYASPAWANAPKHSIMRFQLQHNKAIRVASDLPRWTSSEELHNAANLPMIGNAGTTTSTTFKTKYSQDSICSKISTRKEHQSPYNFTQGGDKTNCFKPDKNKSYVSAVLADTTKTQQNKGILTLFSLSTWTKSQMHRMVELLLLEDYLITITSRYLALTQRHNAEFEELLDGQTYSVERATMSLEPIPVMLFELVSKT